MDVNSSIAMTHSCFAGVMPIEIFQSTQLTLPLILPYVKFFLEKFQFQAVRRGD
jgi:hypothetical protein